MNATRQPITGALKKALSEWLCLTWSLPASPGPRCRPGPAPAVRTQLVLCQARGGSHLKAADALLRATRPVTLFPPVAARPEAPSSLASGRGFLLGVCFALEGFAQALGDASWQLMNECCSRKPPAVNECGVLCLGMALGFSLALENEVTGGGLATRCTDGM